MEKQSAKKIKQEEEAAKDSGKNAHQPKNRQQHRLGSCSSLSMQTASYGSEAMEAVCGPSSNGLHSVTLAAVP